MLARFRTLALKHEESSGAAGPSGGRTVDPAAWRGRREPCPCLQDGKCAAYEARPVACRAFHARTPAEWCDPDDVHFLDRINPHLDPPAVLLQALRVLSARLGLPEPTDLHRGMAILG